MPLLVTPVLSFKKKNLNAAIEDSSICLKKKIYKAVVDDSGIYLKYIYIYI